MSMENMIREIIREIGDDPMREGLIDTPKRIIKSWNELYSGYKKDPADIFTVFDNDGYNEMVILGGSEFYSMCEHHMLPFFGKAYIAYIPDKKIVGISKLARLLEIYTRRLQIQERIGQQVTAMLDKYLEPKGSACILKAQHLCMTMRGINKQHSIMTTSSITGVFMKEIETRNELMRLIS